MTNLLIIAVVVLITNARFRRDFGVGLATAVFFFVLLPTEIRLPSPGALPEVTVHRVLLVLCAFHVLQRRAWDSQKAVLPVMALLAVVAATRVVSTLNAIDFLRSAKDSLGFLLETLLFYAIVGSSLKDKGTVIRVLWGITYALIAVAGIATVEKYVRVNIAARLVPDMADNWITVTATFRHRILLGYAMAMGFPLVVAMRSLAASKWQRVASNVGMLVLPAACYFANSRGPWVGIALGGGILILGSNRGIRKRLAYLAALAVLVLLLRPGVYETIESRWQHTKSTDTLKGRSASYRLELWKVAFRQVTKSFDRFLFGYGGESTELMQLGDEFEFGGGSGMLGYTSWDSEYAADLVKYGVLGLLAEFLMYSYVLKLSVESWRSAPLESKEVIGASVATIAIFLWAMTNVAIFNPQLTYLFWTVVAVAVRAPYLEFTSDAPGPELGENQEDYQEAGIVQGGPSPVT